MYTEVMVLACPAYTDRHGTTRCGLPAAVEDRYTIYSTDGPQDSAKFSCPRGHRHLRKHLVAAGTCCASPAPPPAPAPGCSPAPGRPATPSATP